MSHRLDTVEWTRRYRLKVAKLQEIFRIYRDGFVTLKEMKTRVSELSHQELLSRSVAKGCGLSYLSACD